MSERFKLSQHASYCKVSFLAMASPCEILIDSEELEFSLGLGLRALDETQRIEAKFSRYRDDNIIYQINHADGEPVLVDEETAAMLDFAEQLFLLSEGRFDITSGILRRVWTFDGSDKVPSTEDVAQLLPLIGWQHCNWQRPNLRLPAGMEVDLGGIGKEYAVDKVFELLTGMCDCALLVNFGGDLRARGPRRDGRAWQVGLEKLSQNQPELIDVANVAMATSGDSRRFLLRDGQRYSHILDPRSGWPVTGAPKAITAIAPSCVQAGVYASLALMMGSDAESFLEEQDVQYWSIR